MKLDKSVIDRRVEILQKEGITFACGADVGGNLPAQALLDSADAVVLCCGAKPRGPESAGDVRRRHILCGRLSDQRDPQPASTPILPMGRAIDAAGKRVLVIGGGDTGNDCVGTAIRQGCASVVQLEMMPCPPDARAPGQRLARMAAGTQDRLRPAGGDRRLGQDRGSTKQRSRNFTQTKPGRSAQHWSPSLKAKLWKNPPAAVRWSPPAKSL